MKKIIVIFYLAFAAQIALGQSSYTIMGTALDGDKTPLIAATVVVLNPADSTMIGFAITNDSGEFEVKGIKQGEYNIQVTYIGFGTFQKRISVSGPDKKIQLGEVILSSDLNKLDEILVKGEFIPMVIKKDTVEYNADAYRVRPNANVEELLKQMPGIEVESDGSITAQGEQVGNVTVDGKKFFGNDPKVATKNIPADAVKKVQVFDQKSDKAEFSGVDDGQETKTINLELKEDKKVGSFGNIEAGYGTDDRYKAKVSLNKFSGKYQIAGIVSYNNINDPGFSFSEYQTLTGSSGFRRGNSFNVSGPVNFDGLSNGNTRSLTSGLNFSYNPSSKTEVTTSYFLTLNDQSSLDTVVRENTLAARAFTEFNNSLNDRYDWGHNVTLDAEFKPDSIQRVDVDIRYQLNTTENRFYSDLITTGIDGTEAFTSDQFNFTDGDRDDLSASFEYNRRLGKVGRIFTAGLDIGNTLDKDSTLVDQLNTVNSGIDPVIVDLLQDQISRNDDKSYEINLNYKEPLGNGNFLDFFIERSNTNTERIKNFFDYELELTSPRSLNEELSALNTTDIIYSRAGLDYTIDKEKYVLTFGGKYNYSQLKGEVIGQDDINNTFSYFLPRVSFRFDDPNIRINYRTNVNEPSANQLQSIVDNTDPNNLYIGNPELRPEYSHTFNGRYFFFDRFNLNSLWFNINYSITTDKIKNAQTIDENFIRTRTPVNIDRESNIRGSISYSTPIRPVKLKTRLSGGLSLNNTINLVNGIEDNVERFQPYGSLSLENTNNEIISLRVSGRWDYNRNQFELSTDQNNDFKSQKYTATLLLNLPKSFYVDADWSYQIYSQDGFGNDNELQLLNASFSKGFMDDRLTLKLSAFDILNQNQGLSRTITDTYIQQSITNSIQRYYMFSFIYKLSAFQGPQNNVKFMRH
jgi:hypothetical protein